MRGQGLQKLSAVLMVLAACCYVVALLDGGATNNVGAFMPAMAPRAANQAPRSYLEAIEMSTQFTDPYVLKSYKKKNAMTGSTKNLMGYKVGSRAPSMSRSSGTTNFQATGKFGYKGEREANTDINVAREEKKKIAVDFGIGLSAASLLVAILS
jgi:hypothetical protein